VKVGDLVAIKSNMGDDMGKVYCTGIYLGTSNTWKDWHLVCDMKGRQMKWDEPFWILEVISESQT